MFPSWNHSRTLRTAVVASHRGDGRIDSGLPGLQPAAVTLIGAGTADPIGKAVLKRGRSGQTRKIRDKAGTRSSARFQAPAFTRYVDAAPGCLVDADRANSPA